jgi:hypothetical protein
MAVLPPGFVDARHSRSISATMVRHPKIEPEGYGFNSNASMKFRVNGF